MFAINVCVHIDDSALPSMQVSAVTYNPLLTDFVSSTSNTYPLNLALVHNAVWSQTNGALPPAAPATATTGDNSSSNVLWWPEHSHRSILGILAAPTAPTTTNNQYIYCCCIVKFDVTTAIESIDNICIGFVVLCDCCCTICYGFSFIYV